MQYSASVGRQSTAQERQTVARVRWRWLIRPSPMIRDLSRKKKPAQVNRKPEDWAIS